jgi:hypothetical protein
LYSALKNYFTTLFLLELAMRVSLQVLRERGRRLGAGARKVLQGDLRTKKFVAGDSLVKVLEFVEVRSACGLFELSDPKVKECWAEKSLIVYSGLNLEEGAWVAQEWLVDVNPAPALEGSYPRWGAVDQASPTTTPVGSGWSKPSRRYESQS